MATFTDEEFGTVTLRRSSRASTIRIRVAPNGRLSVSMPLYAPVFMVKRLIKNSRPQLREMFEQGKSEAVYEDGMRIGKSHTLITRPTSAAQATARRHGLQIVVSLPEGSRLDDANVNRIVRDTVIEALRVEAKSYLPKRLAFLADKHGFFYDKVRFSHASGRWGSCSSNATISLNIALMKLPFELIDYVLIHELSHTVHMNHSEHFWQRVEDCYPEYKKWRSELKKQTPSI